MCRACFLIERLQHLIANLKVHKKYPTIGRLVEVDMPEHGLCKWDRLIAGADLATIFDLDSIWVLPATIVLFSVFQDIASLGPNAIH